MQDAQELADIREVKVDANMPKPEKIAEYNRQIKDPEHYRCNIFKVTAIHPKSAPPIEERLKALEK